MTSKTHPTTHLDLQKKKTPVPSKCNNPSCLTCQGGGSPRERWPDQPERLQVRHNLVLATSLKQFLHPVSKSRIMMMPYWVYLDEGGVAFDYVNEHTCPHELKVHIKAGLIYIRDCDLKRGHE